MAGTNSKRSCDSDNSKCDSAQSAAAASGNSTRPNAEMNFDILRIDNEQRPKHHPKERVLHSVKRFKYNYGNVEQTSAVVTTKADSRNQGTSNQQPNASVPREMSSSSQRQSKPDGGNTTTNSTGESIEAQIVRIFNFLDARSNYALPPGWMQMTNPRFRFPIYCHKNSNICTLYRPYHVFNREYGLRYIIRDSFVPRMSNIQSDAGDSSEQTNRGDDDDEVGNGRTAQREDVENVNSDSDNE